MNLYAFFLYLFSYFTRLSECPLVVLPGTAVLTLMTTYSCLGDEQSKEEKKGVLGLNQNMARKSFHKT